LLAYTVTPIYSTNINTVRAAPGTGSAAGLSGPRGKGGGAPGGVGRPGQAQWNFSGGQAQWNFSGGHPRNFDLLV